MAKPRSSIGKIANRFGVSLEEIRVNDFNHGNGGHFARIGVNAGLAER